MEGNPLAPKKIIPFLLLIIIIVSIYSNTFFSQWHLDDYENITINPNIHITDLSLESLSRAFYFKKNKNITRPFSRLTFAINWYVGKNNVFGYHVVNISIHIITAFYLFLFISQLLNTPQIKLLRNENVIYFTALLSAVLWAIHPIQTQAVTYIVQRMASMAAMFYIMSMFYYLKFRMDDDFKRRILFLIIASICFGLGLATKENTATLPIAILLIEIIFFQDMNVPEIRKKVLTVSVIICIVVILFSSWLFLNKSFSVIFKGTGYRFFSTFQRLMTEPRVVIFYLSEIFYPVPTRFSIEHDFNVSTSLLSPWTTLPSIAVIILLFILAILQTRKRPLLSFGILFFFLNHLIESTVIGLEIIFEHRNYLPSFFLFLYLSFVLKGILDQYINKNKAVFAMLTACIIFMVMSLSISTYVRNMDWETELSILRDAVQKAPNSARPLNNLARAYYIKTGKSDIALIMLKKALTLKANNSRQEALILNNIGGIYYENGNENDAIQYFQKAIDQYPTYSAARYKLAIALANIGKFNESKNHLDKTILNIPENVNSPINLKGLILAKEKKYEEAFHLFKKCLGIRHNDRKALLNIGSLYYNTGNYQRAETFFKTAYENHPREIFTLLWLIKLNLKVNDTHDVRKYMEKLFTNVSAKSIVTLPSELSNNNVFDIGFIKPHPSKLLLKTISEGLKVKM